MDSREVMNRVGAIIEAHGTGLLATVDEDGDPHLRWLTPTLLPDSPGAVYALTTPRFSKVVQVRAHARVEWMFQTPTLDEVISIRGPLNVVENPSLRSEVLEVLGPRLQTFWKLAHDARDLVVLETVAEEAIRYLPMLGRKDVVHF
ncbi:MAG: pyridoxamine 5'-phosphate oxidase family protein [Spirochaetia bacterium]|jgi:pyridoxamine 5'-phosphate oxidase